MKKLLTLFVCISFLTVLFSACKKCYECTRNEECYEYYFDENGNHHTTGMQCSTSYSAWSDYIAHKNSDLSMQNVQASFYGVAVQQTITPGDVTLHEHCGKKHGKKQYSLTYDVDVEQSNGFNCIAK
ncbi:MAG: hypothetical protein WCI97_07325 [Bacteroidota bacterium]